MGSWQRVPLELAFRCNGQRASWQVRWYTLPASLLLCVVKMKWVMLASRRARRCARGHVSNRNEIKNGTILRLTTSPAQNAQQLHERIQSSSMDSKLEALKDLASLSRDVTFAQEFINLDGILLLTQMVESGTERYQKLQKIMKPCFGDMLSFTLTAFVELMDHGIVSWDTFSVAFIKKIASFVNKSGMDTSILQRSLAILESMVLNSHDLYQKVAQEITIGQLIPHLQGTDQEIQTYTIAVINALFLKAPDERRQEMANILAQKQLRSIILTHVIRAQRAINNEMAHQLYVLQVLTFNLLEDRMMAKMDPQDQAQRDIIFELRRIAFDVESEPNASSGSMEKRKSMYTRDYKKLGFIVSTPAQRGPSFQRRGADLSCITHVSPPSVWSACASRSRFHIFQMFSWFKQDHMKISAGRSETE
uniref:Engulfment and cell motility 1 n=1 Tax=Molossus molossus TaxID=27622 RepID=A0A7J8HBC3_MOLMO|nr:engulfment and cell motility 1 [Molossus molossus]